MDAIFEISIKIGLEKLEYIEEEIPIRKNVQSISHNLN